MSDTSVWVGAYPAPAEAEAILPNGTQEERDELHVTLGYFTFTADAPPEGTTPEDLWEQLSWLSGFLPCSGSFTGRACFYGTRIDAAGEIVDVDHRVLLVSSTKLFEAGEHLRTRLRWMLNDQYSRPWIPHMTVGNGALHARRQPVEFDRAYLTWGIDRYPILGRVG